MTTDVVARSVGAALVLAFVLLPRVSEGCSCVTGIPPCQTVWNATGVVEATVTAIDSVESAPMWDGGPPMRERRVRLQNVQARIGNGTDEVVTGFGGGDCGYDFTVGTRYLIVFHRRPTDGKMTASICSPTQPASWPSAFRSYLDGLSTPSPGATVSGKVWLLRGAVDFSGQRNEPLPGVQVRLNGPVQQQAQSGRDGEFRFERLPAGDYTLVSELPSGRGELSPIRPSTLTLPNTHACGAVTLTTAVNGRIEGTVVDETGRPVPDASINLRPAELRRAGQMEYRFGKTGPDGTYWFDQLPPGRFVVGVNLSRGPHRASPFAITYARLASGATPDVVELASGARQPLAPIIVRRLAPVLVAGEVRLEDGRLVAGATLSAKPAGERPVNLIDWSGKTAEQGTFVAELLQDVTYTIEARFAQMVGVVEIVASSSGDPVVVRLKPRRE
jgi:carboxypeptidase family protein